MVWLRITGQAEDTQEEILSEIAEGEDISRHRVLEATILSFLRGRFPEPMQGNELVDELVEVLGRTSRVTRREVGKAILSLKRRNLIEVVDPPLGETGTYSLGKISSDSIGKLPEGPLFQYDSTWKGFLRGRN